MADPPFLVSMRLGVGDKSGNCLTGRHPPEKNDCVRERSIQASMYSPRLLATIIVVLAVAGTLGCGRSGGQPSAVLVRVGASHVITQGMFTHWMLVAALRDAEESGYGAGGTQRVVVPDPPKYVACIASLPAKLGAATPSRGSVKRQCEQHYDVLKAQVLQSLITAEWFFAEGEARGLHVSGAEVKRRVAKVRRNGFATQAAWESYLRRGGETEADQQFRSRLKLYAAKVQPQLAGGREALLAFVKDFPIRWAARTNCRNGFVVADCKQYRGPASPEVQIL
jgi:hypothetical protein